ncbi:MAG: hypothetical protein GYA55_11680 [SAR324 cluster bacterium]|uniref:Nucleotidyltransferase family protein n=1 Tax=SAR324 cluster bacterium TaxID=2024889 RepID=A0A7X9FT67_9DELT|nr:hypothetical protein [SAR324 cluster bacterium]
MELSKDLLEFIHLLNEKKVDYVVIGGWAVALHGKPRYTKDIDILIKQDPENAAKVISVLHDFGFGSLGLSSDDFLRPDHIIQLGVEPNRIDLLTSLSGVSFDEASKERVVTSIQGESVPVIGLDALLKNKRIAGRDQDLVDARYLEKLSEKK